MIKMLTVRELCCYYINKGLPSMLCKSEDEDHTDAGRGRWGKVTVEGSEGLIGSPQVSLSTYR